MTEASEDGNYLVRVQAQVMTRDDSTGGWVPLSGGGLANVSVRRRAISVAFHPPGCTNGSRSPTLPSTTPTHSATSAVTNSQTGHGSSTSSPPGTTKRRYEYLIYGKRITDQSVVLSCTIKKDFQYNKVMPTFHHWRTGEKKFGLTFTTAADARAFDKGVKTAVEELLEDVDEDDVFVTLNLPVDNPDARQSAESRRGIVQTSNYETQCTGFADPYRPINYETSTDNYPYVQLTPLNHDYMYPVIDDHKGDRVTDRRNSASSLKKPDIIVTQPTKNAGKRGNVRLRCKHCQELYAEEHNPKGSCEYSPDPIRRCIDTVSCLLCAQCMLYHCMSDAEGDFAQNPCSCSMEEGCCRRWFGLALLSVIAPCLLLYPPLRAIHRCGMSCGICGGRHHPME
ncbi:sprouty-related, EVH1 domain-containing protein 3 isoform X2 [Venturia canescens]|uniref:sprouty-related, EVH1 domain-containing protein 3 isoform X2 n=1 Tax=Venturia canescens TaxID=32260 RepID=UPI001C9D60FE|nr:sprouty-related, EVH1 domain-containing protein 3 isoform X2 [Venturia canescens]